MIKRIIKHWYKLSIKKKMFTIISIIGLMMVITILLNVKVMYVFIDNAKILMDDNLSSYKLQEAMGEETRTFSNLIQNRSAENESFYETACNNMKERLETMNYDYVQIGEERYEILWNIRNSYEEYEKQRNKFIIMGYDDPDYIKELYKTYKMQDYIEMYIKRFTGEVIDIGANYYEDQIPLLKWMPYALIGISLMAVVGLFLLFRLMTKAILQTLSQLVRVSRGIENNDFSMPDVDWSCEDEIGELVYSFNKMKHATKDYVHTLEEKRSVEEKLYQQELEKANLEQRFSFAQLQLIKSQLKPHFLFNTLNMITRMAQMEEAPVTEEMLIALSNLLRYSLRTTEPFTPLDQELKVLRDYMYIQKMRFGERITWDIQCEVPANQIEVPIFLIQPLVENSIIHGLSSKEEGGRVVVKITSDGEILTILVEDTGAGMEKERLQQIRESMKERGRGVGIGLGNIYRRISAYYEQGEVTVDSLEGKGTTVKVSFGRRK